MLLALIYLITKQVMNVLTQRCQPASLESGRASKKYGMGRITGHGQMRAKNHNLKREGPELTL